MKSTNYVLLTKLIIQWILSLACLLNINPYHMFPSQFSIVFKLFILLTYFINVFIYLIY